MVSNFDQTCRVFVDAFHIFAITVSFFCHYTFMESDSKCLLFAEWVPLHQTTSFHFCLFIYLFNCSTKLKLNFNRARLSVRILNFTQNIYPLSDVNVSSYDMDSVNRMVEANIKRIGNDLY